MEDILHIYELPYNENVPVICMDEKPYQLLGEIREPLPLRSGNNRKTDSEYIRCGTCSIFIFTEPLADYRHVAVCEHRTRKEWAEQIRYLLTEVYPEKQKIILVMDNLNTHTKASLYQTFPPEEAYELAKRLEIHYTPKHGSWLDIAEIELSALGRQCIANNRIPDLPSFEISLNHGLLQEILLRKELTGISQLMMLEPG